MKNGVFSEKAEFITTAEFAAVEPINVYHLEGETIDYKHPDELKNVHIKMNIEFSKAMNVEVGRLLGWIRCKEDIVKEFNDEMNGAEIYFNKNLSLEKSNIKLLGVK